VAAVADGDDLELVVGPAGAGKTTTLAAAALNLSVQGRIRSDWHPPPLQPKSSPPKTDMAADTLDKLLTEHPSQPTTPTRL
jgi:ABC-type multidrug transport system ATPase subunit